MKIKNINLKNFKGVIDKTYAFKDSTKVTGANGSGKSTIIDAYFWVFTNKDYEMKEPMVMPIGNELSATEVTLVIDVDGTEKTIKKIQTRNPKGSTYATSNMFEIDGIPFNNTKFKAELKDMNITDDLFMASSNPYYFNKLTKDGKREVLLGMADKVSDKEVADELDFERLSKELEQFSMEDIKARETKKIKDFTKQVGKDNCLINAKIEALENTKAKLVVLKAPKKVLDVLDDDIQNLKRVRLNSTQNIADCERLISQISKVEKEQIQRCEQNINSKFENVGFKLWEENQSGDLVPCCIPMIDGYGVGESANTGRELLAKISIMNGIASHYGLNFPLLIDNCECLDSKSVKAIKTDRQLIMASVSNSALKIS